MKGSKRLLLAAAVAFGVFLGGMFTARRMGQPYFITAETLPPNTQPEPADTASDGRLDLNAATLEELVQLPGIGQVLAQRILDYRNLYGPLRTVDELSEVEGIGEKRLEELREVVQAGAGTPDCPFVLSTIHSSKGLEYDRVILMDVADGMLPKALPQRDPSPQELDLYEEERRLFYVGMTRAKRELDIVTFRKPGLESVFSEEVFPPKTKEPPKPEKRKLPEVKRLTKEQIFRISETYEPGTRLRHKTFGPGTLVSRSGDIVIIAFDNGEVKKLALSTALRARQLQPEEQEI